MERQQPVACAVDWLTLFGLVLLISPALTMVHEIGGHAATCLATGGIIQEISAFYVNCSSKGEDAARLVSMAGTGADVLVFGGAYFLWRRATGDLARLALWMVFVGKAMAATGYFLFSGFSGLGDWGPGIGGGVGPLPYALVVRLALIVVGAAAYIAVVKLAMRTLTDMVGGEPGAGPVKKRIAFGYYFVSGAISLLVGLLNPVGLFVVIFSAVASSFGSNAGMISVGLDRRAASARQFVVERNIVVLAAGIVATTVFAFVLGPTLDFRA